MPSVETVQEPEVDSLKLVLPVRDDFDFVDDSAVEDQLVHHVTHRHLHPKSLVERNLMPSRKEVILHCRADYNYPLKGSKL